MEVIIKWAVCAQWLNDSSEELPIIKFLKDWNRPKDIIFLQGDDEIDPI